MAVNLSNTLRSNPVDHFISLIQYGFQNPENIEATVKVLVPESPHDSFCIRFNHDDLDIQKDAFLVDADTTLTIPMETVKRISSEAAFLDFRDPSIIGTIKIEGNLDYANHLGKACLQPSPFVANRFAQLESMHRAKKFSEITEIPYLHKPTQIDMLEAMDRNIPFVVTGMAPECSKWNLDFLAETFGDEIVRVRSATQKQTMSEFIDELKLFESNPYDDMIEGFVKPYTEGAPLPEAMWDDFGPLFFNRHDYIPPQLWLGAVPTHIPTSSLHRDPHTGFLVQVMGKKRLDLYSADQAELLYPHKAYNNYQPCWFKPEDPDYDIYPEARKAKCLSATIGAGELLVQPAGWFHQVYALDSPNMSVSYFWRY